MSEQIRTHENCKYDSLCKLQRNHGDEILIDDEEKKVYYTSIIRQIGLYVVEDCGNCHCNDRGFEKPPTDGLLQHCAKYGKNQKSCENHEFDPSL